MQKQLFSALLFLVFTVSSNAQFVTSALPDARLNHLSKQLFGFPLFQKGLSKSLDSLAASPQFIPDTLIQRTDTSLFYFRGYWKNFNPFYEQMDSVKLIVTEVKWNYSINNTRYIDTLLLFQIEGSLGNTPVVDSQIRSAFKKLNKTITPYFTKSQYNRDYKHQVWNAEWIRYYLSDNPTWTANMTWKKMNSNWTTITVSFITKPINESAL